MGTKMKIAISSTGKNLTDSVSEVFARCPYFIITQIEDGKIQNIEAIKNTVIDQTTGAGISVAQKITEKDVQAVISGNIGPRALSLLQQFNIEVYNGNGKVVDVLQKFISNKLEKFQ